MLPQRARRAGHRSIVAGALLGGIGLVPLAMSCLPGDTRPTPAVLHFTAQPSEAVTAGLSTADGWTITFERLLVGIGGASINGAACNNYGSGRYDRLIEATPPGEQKLAEVYGLGTCSLRFRVRTPSQNAVLGEGVTSDDLDFMKDQGVDEYTPIAGTSVFLKGKAERDGVVKRFAWHFRLGYTFRDCGADAGALIPTPRDADAGDLVTIELQGGEAIAMPIEIHAEDLFRDGLGEDAGLRFEPLAGADLDGDQEITFDELAKLPSPVPLAEDQGDGGGADGGDAGPPSLSDFIYQVLLPRIFVLQGFGRCLADLRTTNL